MALILCDECARHVREVEAACPFCGAARSASEEDTPSPEGPTRMSRAAILLAGAMAMGACDRNPFAREPTIVQPYGAPPNPPTPDVLEPAIAQPYGVPPFEPELMPDVQTSALDAAAVSPDVATPRGTRGRRVQDRPPTVRPAYGAPAAAYGGPPGGAGEFKRTDEPE
jgi:hypothetical protein